MLFTFCQKQLVWFLKLKIPFRGEKLTVFNAFPVLLALHQQDTRIFSLLLNPDWSIQISRAPAVCKVYDVLFFRP